MLYLISKLYGLGAYVRRKIYYNGLKKRKYLPVPVISIGNLSTGGTGKTPFTIFLAKKFQKEGYRVCVLSRGYRRKSRGTIIVSDGENIHCSWEEAGDEPYLIASEGIPVVVSNSRYHGGLKALHAIKPDVFILDDGFQHFQLYRNLDILLIDATKPFWEDKLIPSGFLREPVEFYRYADLLIINRLNRLDKNEKEKFLSKVYTLKKPFFVSIEEVKGLSNRKKIYPLNILTEKKVGIFSGLGNNNQFFSFVSNLGKKYRFKIGEKVSFPDHHSYAELKLPAGHDLWLTTEKDIIKLPDSIIKDHKIYALKYSLFLEEGSFKDLEKMVFSEKDKNKVKNGAGNV